MSRLLISHLIVGLFLTAQISAASPKVIYGEDNRKDLFETQNSLYLSLADSTAALMKSSSISINGGVAKISASAYSARVCKSERFYDQPVAAFCSGFLVAPDVFVTAGHCIKDQTGCSSTSFVFGFGIKTARRGFPTQLPAGEVYTCKKLLGREQVGTGADWAVVQLDRAVANHKPLQVNRTGAISKGASLVVIGHPSGLPTKISDGAIVRDPSPAGYFTANLDTYGGNSGSAVFSINSGLVEGILVRGENDFVYNSAGQCYVSQVCPADGCRGEDVTKISAVLRNLPFRRAP